MTDSFAGYVHRVQFHDEEGVSPFCVPQGPIRFDGVKVEARISREHPLRIETAGGMGQSEVLVSFVVHEDDVTYPKPGDDDETEWTVGGHKVYVPPQFGWDHMHAPADDRHTWQVIEQVEVAHPNGSHYPAERDADGKGVTADRWVRVWLQVKPEFTYGERPGVTTFAEVRVGAQMRLPDGRPSTIFEVKPAPPGFAEHREVVSAIVDG